MFTKLLGLTPNQELRFYLISLLKPYQKEKLLPRLFAEANAVHNTILTLCPAQTNNSAHDFGLSAKQVNFLRILEFTLKNNPDFSVIDSIIDESLDIQVQVEELKIPDFSLFANVNSHSVMAAVGTQ